MGALMRAYDWSTTSLGPPETWSQSLRVTVRLMLNTGHPMYVFWGPDAACLYNDAYSQSIGPERHPGSLGRPAREVWAEIWDVVGPQIAQVMAGRGSTWHENQLIPITRNGRREDVYWTYSYGPIDDETAPNGIGGVLVVCAETTAAVLSTRQLAESEERLQLALAGGGGVGTWDWDVQADRVVADARFARLYGVDPDKARTGAPIAEFFEAMHPDDQVRVRTRIGAVLRTGEEFNETYRLVQPDGSNRWVAAQGRCALDANGKPLRFPGVSFDVTQARQAQDALAASEARFRSAVEAVQGVLWTNTADGRMEGPQPAWAALTGQTEEEHSGYGWAAAVHPDDAQPTVDAWHAALAARTTFLFEHRVRRWDGVWRTFSIRAVPTLDASGAILEWVGVHTDVTAARAAEARLKELNAALAQRVQERTLERDRAWKNSQDLQVVVRDGVFREANAAWTTILGWDVDEVIGHRHIDFIHPDDRTSSEGALATVSLGELPVFENRCCHKDGGFRWISWLAAPSGDLIYASGRNVTAEREQAEALARTEEALRQSQKMEAVGQLTGGIAHDFNNLLTGISGSFQMIERRVAQGRPEALARYLEAGQGAVRRAAALTQRLLAFSRRQTLDPKATDANRLIAGLEELLRRTAGPSIEVEVVGAGGLWTILVDPHQLENALLNLCINARDAMPDGGRLTIETANKWLDDAAARDRDLHPGQYVSLCVTDTGTGMAPDVIARAFDPFFTTKPIGKGTGLGLSMIYGFVRQSGGQVRIYSECGHGTTMCLYLPRHFGEAEADEPRGASADASDGGQGETVLVVDDEPSVRLLVVDLLQDAGYRAIEAEDGAAGLRILQSPARVDLLITDVGLPGGMNGRQVADAGRALRPGLKALFITGYAENAVVGNGHLEPGMQIITKPFAVETLRDKIRSMLDG